MLNRIIVQLPRKLHIEWTKDCEQYLNETATFTITTKYPIIQIITLLFSLFTALHFGWSYTMLAALLLTWILIVLAIIDWNTHLLPDHFTLPGIWLGLLFNLFNLFTDLKSAVIGAVVGYLFLWSIYWIYKFSTNKEGMGYGDFKLLAMLGAFLGWQALPSIILLSSLFGTLLGGIFILKRGYILSQPIAFGPFLALSGWISLVGNVKIYSFYDILRI